MDISSTNSTIKMMYVGDWGVNTKGKFDVADSMEKYASKIEFNFIISLGDNFYLNGVDNVNDPLFKKVYEDVYNKKENLKKLKWWVILGNHDWIKKNSAQAQIDYHLKNPNWNLPHYYYTKEYYLDSGEQMQQIFIDTSFFNTDERDFHPVMKGMKEKQLNWLKEILEEGKDIYKWRFVYGHHVIFYHNWGVKHMKELEVLLSYYHIDAFFCGHQHLLQHLQVNYENHNSKVDYFVNGAGGMHTNRVEYPNDEHNIWVNSTYGFMLHFVNSKESRYDMIDSNGNLIYQYKKYKI
eukprot:gene7390-11712_t